MKAILMLVAVQTALIVALFFKVSTIEETIDGSGPGAESSADGPHAELGSRLGANATPVALSEAAIRSIIREELAAQLGPSTAGASTAAGSRSELHAGIDLKTHLQVIDLDGLRFFEQIVAHNVLESFNVENFVFVFWFIQNQPK